MRQDTSRDAARTEGFAMMPPEPREAEAAAAALAAGAEHDGVGPPVPEAASGAADRARIQPPPRSSHVVAWKDLPRKGQLALLTVARLSEPVTQTSLQAYLFYQLKWFDPSLPDATISSQAGVLHASFTAAQFVTAMVWGRLSETRGRKFVLLIGLLGTCASSLAFGLSTSFWQALLFRTLGGALNGNVGVLRTMISEIIKEKKYQSRAFLLLPMTFNIGVVIGPVLGGILSDPAGTYPDLFGHVRFLVTFPYAVPNLVSAVFLLGATLAVWLGLEETLEDKKDSPDLGLRLGKRLAAALPLMLSRDRRRADGPEYEQLASSEMELAETSFAKARPARRRYTRRLEFGRIFTRNVSLTFVVQFLLAFHIGTFNSLWFVFVSSSVWDPATSPEYKPILPFRFTGGLGLPPKAVGASLAILGVIGISMQLFLYPRVSGRLGTLRTLRFFLPCFPLAYFVVPYLSVIPSTTPPPSAKTGVVIWLGIACVLFIQVLGRTFALPSQTILVNNCSPHPSVLGTVHGLGQSVSSGARTIGPMVGGWVYGYGLRKGIVGLQWWILSFDAILCWVASLLVEEGDGHEIFLEDEEEEAPLEAEEAQGGRA